MPADGNKTSSRSPRHSYSPRYIEYLHNSPHNSPRENTNVPLPAPNTVPLWGANAAKPKVVEESKVKFDDSQPHYVIQHGPKGPKKKVIFNEKVGSSPRLKDAPERYGSPIMPHQPSMSMSINPTSATIQSPQPCVSPSSLINHLYDREQEGFSAPIYHDYTSQKSSSNGAQKKPGQPEFGLFNFNWDSSDDGN